jgi:hypothetical protein
VFDGVQWKDVCSEGCGVGEEVRCSRDAEVRNPKFISGRLSWLKFNREHCPLSVSLNKKCLSIPGALNATSDAM